MVREPFKYLDLEKMKVARTKLFYHFYLFSIASIIIILFIAGVGLYYVLRNLVIQEAEISAIRISTAARDCEIRRYIGQHYNTNERFFTIPSEELPEVDHHMRVFITPFDIVKINIFNTEPRVIYSTDSKTIGELAPDNALLLSALTGIPNSKYVSKRQVLDSADKDWKSIAIVETHVPMYGTDGKIIGSFEIQKDITRNLTMTGKIFIRSWCVLTGIVVVVFAALMFVIRYNVQTINASTFNLITTNEQLEREIQDRERLEKELLNIIERERQRTGQELHDSIGQQLTGIEFMIETLGEKLSAKSLSEEASYAARINTRVSQATEQAHKLSKGLHPVDLDKNGLMSALQELTTNTEDLFSVLCTLKCEKAIPINDISISINLYRIAQEAITNAIKHGKAKNIEIELSVKDSRLILMVKNDGMDFPEGQTQSRGMGLKIMRYRAEIINGSLDIHKGADGGTVVTCMLPDKTGPQ